MHVRRKWRGGRCRQSTRKDADGEVVEERELDRDPGRVRPRQSASATAIWDHRRSSRSQSTTCRSGERAIQLGGRSSIGSTDCSSCLRLINANEPHGRCQISRRRLRQAANRQRLNRLQRSPRLSPRVTARQNIWPFAGRFEDGARGGESWGCDRAKRLPDWAKIGLFAGSLSVRALLPVGAIT